MKLIRNIILLITTGSLAGCASIIGRGMSESPDEAHPYIGVVGDGLCIVSGLTGKHFDDSDNVIGSIGESLAFIVAGTLDMPLSFCMDTILLPRDIYMMTKDDKEKESIGIGLPIAEEPSLITVRTDRVYGDSAVTDGVSSKAD